MTKKEQIEAAAETILNTQIDPGGMSANDLLDDDQSALLYLIIYGELCKAAGIDGEEQRR